MRFGRQQQQAVVAGEAAEVADIRRRGNQQRVDLQLAERNGSAISRHQQQLSGGLAAFQIAMRLGGLRKRIDLVDMQLQFALADPVQHVAGAPVQFFDGG